MIQKRVKFSRTSTASVHKTITGYVPSAKRVSSRVGREPAAAIACAARGRGRPCRRVHEKEAAHAHGSEQ